MTYNEFYLYLAVDLVGAKWSRDTSVQHKNGRPAL
jgi:hypothetical protein